MHVNGSSQPVRGIEVVLTQKLLARAFWYGWIMVDVYFKWFFPWFSGCASIGADDRLWGPIQVYPGVLHHVFPLAIPLLVHLHCLLGKKSLSKTGRCWILLFGLGGHSCFAIARHICNSEAPIHAVDLDSLGDEESLGTGWVWSGPSLRPLVYFPKVVKCSPKFGAKSVDKQPTGSVWGENHRIYITNGIWKAQPIQYNDISYNLTYNDCKQVWHLTSIIKVSCKVQ